MSDLSKRLRASVRMGAHHGDAMERGVCGKQMIEAADALDRAARLRPALRDAIRALEEGVPIGGDLVADLKATLAGAAR